jgi:hypothetical protein
VAQDDESIGVGVTARQHGGSWGMPGEVLDSSQTSSRQASSDSTERILTEKRAHRRGDVSFSVPIEVVSINESRRIEAPGLVSCVCREDVSRGIHVLGGRKVDEQNQPW